MDKILKSSYEGTLELGNSNIDVAVLENGQRIITQSGVFRALGRPVRGTSRVIGIPTFMDAGNLQPYIDQQLKSVIKKVEYYDKNGKSQQGFDCHILPLVCDLYLRARQDNTLTPNQIDTAIKAEILVRSLAKVAIISLIDEATGYQHEREKDELQKILKAYIAEELLPWQKRFPDVYYKELFRLNGWDFTVQGIKKRPSVIGTWTNKLIYEQLPSGILTELKSKTPKSALGNKTNRYHQLLTLDVGEPNLTAQISQIITLFKLSDNMGHMWSQFEKLKSRQQGQLELPFNFDHEGHTIELQNDKIDSISTFNHSLSMTLKEPPK